MSLKVNNSICFISLCLIGFWKKVFFREFFVSHFALLSLGITISSRTTISIVTRESQNLVYYANNRHAECNYAKRQYADCRDAYFSSFHFPVSILISLFIFLYLSLSFSVFLYLSSSFFIFLYLSLSFFIFCYLSLTFFIFLYLFLTYVFLSNPNIEGRLIYLSFCDCCDN